MKKSKGAKAIEEVALKHGISTDEARKEITIAIEKAMTCPTPEAREFWDKLTKHGKTKPTPEKFIVAMAKRIKDEKG